MKQFLKAVTQGFMLFCTLSAGGAVADTPETPVVQTKINWLLYSFPPFLTPTSNEPENEPKGEGPAVVFLEYANKHMAEFEHEFQVANLPRVLGLMRNNVLACNPLLLKTPERESFIEYSHPILVLLPHHVVVAKNNYHKLEAYLDIDGNLDLSKLVASPELSTSITKKRAYPSIISSALENADKDHSSILSSTNLYTPIKQLIAGRIDYAIAYPSEVYWYTSEIENNHNLDLKFIPISGVPTHVLSYVGCTKNEQGIRIIQKINEVTLMAGARPPWVEHQLRYLDADTRAKLEEILKQVWSAESP